MPTVSANGIELYYETRGSGVPIVFLTATGWPADVWELSCLPALAERFQTIALDYRGVGRSTHAPGPYSMELLAEDTLGLLDALGIARAHLFGMSVGGRVAQVMALRWPERVRSMALLASTAGHPERTSDGVPLDVALHLGEDGYEGYWRRHLDADFTFTPKLRAERPEVIDRLRQAIWAHRAPLELYLHHIVARRRHALGERVRAIRVPTLVVASRGDQVERSGGNHLGESQYLADNIPGAELAVIEGGRHLFLWEVPEQVTPLVADFFARH